jgi:hypothetical protein
VAEPGALGAARRRVASELFHEPGGATGRAVALLRDLLDYGRVTTPVTDRGETESLR